MGTIESPSLVGSSSIGSCKAVIFAQMVIDPSETVQGDRRLRETKLKIQNEREKLFDIVREL